MINTNYWYYGQIRHYIAHTLRIFQNFNISEGYDENMKPILRRIPCVYMSTDKSVANLLNNNTDTVLTSCPKMILVLSNVRLDSEKMSGPAYYPVHSHITEKRFNKDIENYTYKPGNSYNITRINPLPLGLEFKLYIITTMQDHKFQLFEQIRSIFSPTLELQTSENPLDWSRVTSITLTGLNWSSKGTENLDTTLDTMDMTFDVMGNLDMPSLVEKETLIEQINHQIGDGKTLEDMLSWNLEDVTRLYSSPTNNRISVYLDENNEQKIKLEPSEYCSTWSELLETYNFKFNKLKLDININCLTDSNIDNRNDIVGHIHLNDDTPDILTWHIDETTLPRANLANVDDIINSHSHTPKNILGERYLILDSIPNNTKMWGKLYDENDEELESNGFIPENSIIEYSKNDSNYYWKISLNPDDTKGVFYVKPNSNINLLYTYNYKLNSWVDVINKTYGVGYWRISKPSSSIY